MSPALSHEVVLATVRDFTERSGATRVTVLLDLGGDSAAPMIECEPGEPIVVNEEHVVPAGEYAQAQPLAVPAPKPIPATALDADPQTGQIAAPIGALEALADAVTALAVALGGRTVAVGEWATRQGDGLTVAARAGEAPVLAIGEQQFQFPGTASQP